MSKWENFSLGFTYLSPVVGVYTVFATAFVSGGPPMWWTYIAVGLGQFLVCLIFGEIVSQFPISGRPLSLGAAAGGQALGVDGGMGLWLGALLHDGRSRDRHRPVPRPLVRSFDHAGGDDGHCARAHRRDDFPQSYRARACSRGWRCSGSSVKSSARSWWAVICCCSRAISPCTCSSTPPSCAHGSYWPAFLASSLAAIFCYYGFEACGDVAEETPDPSRMIPKAMRMTIYIGGAAATWVCLAFVLAIPDIGAVMAGKDDDPIVTLLLAAMGENGFRAVILVVLVSFVSCLLSLQAAASRLVFAYARDQMIFGSRFLCRMSPGHHMPANALLAMGAIPAVIALSSLWLANAIGTIISFAAVGIYIAFQMIVLAALIARAKGWRPAGPFTLGAWGVPVNVLALAYGIAAIVNILWPRPLTAADPWYTVYGMLATTVGVMVIGAAYMVVARPYARGNAPAGDAHALAVRTRTAADAAAN